MNKIHYKASSKKIVFICAFCFALLLLFVVTMQSFLVDDTLLIAIVGSSVSIGILCLYLIKNAKNALCPNCNVDLYNVIDTAAVHNIKVEHCLSCGTKIQI